MRKVFFVFGLCLLMSSGLWAALPPLAQNIVELRAILDDKQLPQLLTYGDVIIDIRRTDTGYLIETNKRQLLVKVIYEQNKMPGPAKFHIEFTNPIEN